MNNYENMPYVRPEDFPSVEFAPAAALREPMRAAINSARLIPGKMELVRAILSEALDLIDGYEPEEPADEPAPETYVAGPDSDDPLDILLGPAESGEALAQ
jgi:hypothetical protein